MTERQVCPACGADRLEDVRATRETLARDGTRVEFADEWTFCEVCGEEFYTTEQSLAASRSRAAAVRTHEGFLTPEQIRSIRGRYDLTQEELERALGVGRKTVVRWEGGTVCQSRAMDTLLRLADEHPGVFAGIARRNGVQILVAGSGGVTMPSFFVNVNPAAVATAGVVSGVEIILASPVVHLSTETGGQGFRLVALPAGPQAKQAQAA